MKTTDECRVELLDALAELSQLRPEWRLGQMLANLAMTAGRMGPQDVWDLEDQEALTAAKTLIAEYSQAVAASEQQNSSIHK
jgi:hypothetical protein